MQKTHISIKPLHQPTQSSLHPPSLQTPTPQSSKKNTLAWIHTIKMLNHTKIRTENALKASNKTHMELQLHCNSYNTTDPPQITKRTYVPAVKELSADFRFPIWQVRSEKGCAAAIWYRRESIGKRRADWTEFQYFFPPFIRGKSGEE